MSPKIENKNVFDFGIWYIYSFILMKTLSRFCYLKEKQLETIYDITPAVCSRFVSPLFTVIFGVWFMFYGSKPRNLKGRHVLVCITKSNISYESWRSYHLNL